MSAVKRFLLHHRHRPEECAVAFAAFRGHPSPLRHRAAVATCLFGGHEVWWDVEAADAPAALAQLPGYVAQRATAVEVREVVVP